MATPTTPQSRPGKRPPVAAIVGGMVALGVVVVAVATSRPPTAPPPASTTGAAPSAPVSVDPAQPSEHVHDEHDGHDHAAPDAKAPAAPPAAVTPSAAKPSAPTPATAVVPPAQRGGRPAGGMQTPTQPPATEDLPPDHPVVAPDNAAQISVQWLGYSCFYIHTPGGAAVVTDPFDPQATGLTPPGSGAHLVTVSSETAAHNHVAGVHPFLDESTGKRLSLEVLRGQSGSRADLQVTPLPTGGGNSAYLIQAGPFRIAHLGALDRALTAAQAKALGRVDLLMLPVGERLSPKDAVATAQRISPRVILPMAYREGEGSGSAARLKPLEAFISASPFAVTPRDADIMLISQAELPASTEIWTLKQPQR